MTIAAKFTCAAFLLAASTAMAAPIPDQLIASLRPKIFIETYIDDVMKPLRQADRGIDGLDNADIALEEASAVAQSRVNKMRVMINDLDGDMKISPEETALSRNKEEIVALDANGDGTAALDEVLSAESKRTNYLTNSVPRLKLLLMLDPDKDGKLMPAELEKLARAAFAEVDKDGNGQVSAEEIAPLKPKPQLSGQPVCHLPRAEADQQVVLYSLYEGAAVTDFGLKAAEDQTTYSRIDIEDGDKPLYIVVSTYEAAVLEFQGDLKRIARLVLVESGKTRPLAAIGVDKDRISWADCRVRFNRADSAEAANARGIVKKALGRDPDNMVGIYAPAAVSLPSGFVQPKAPASRSVGMPTFASRNTPDVIKVDPAKVVSKDGTTKLDVLPGRAGIAQLVEEGALEEIDSRTFKVVKQMTFPSGLHGARAVNFILGKGTPQPRGDPGHSCITNEETGESKGAVCAAR